MSVIPSIDDLLLMLVILLVANNQVLVLLYLIQISGGGGAGGGWDSIFENDQSGKVLDIQQGFKLYEYATQITGAEWPVLKPITSPCPTLKVIGTISKGMIEREELKRMKDRPGFNPDGTPIQLTTVQKTKIVADKVVGGVVRNTLGRVARFANRRLLGRIPEEALRGSYYEAEKPLEEAVSKLEEVEESIEPAAASSEDFVSKTAEAPVEEGVKEVEPVVVISEVKVIEEDEGAIYDAAGIYKSDTQLIEEAISRQVFNNKETENVEKKQEQQLA